MGRIDFTDVVENMVPGNLQKKCVEIADHYNQVNSGKTNRSFVPVFLAATVTLATLRLLSIFEKGSTEHLIIVVAVCFAVYYSISRPLRKRYAQKKKIELDRKIQEDPHLAEAYRFIEENPLLRKSIFS